MFRDIPMSYTLKKVLKTYGKKTIESIFFSIKENEIYLFVTETFSQAIDLEILPRTLNVAEFAFFHTKQDHL